MHAYSYQEQNLKRNNAELKLKLILFMIYTCTRNDCGTLQMATITLNCSHE